MSIAIAIPARYASTRFPGKPLHMIAGQSMLSRVVGLARGVAADYDGVEVFVTTEDQRIADHADAIGVECVMTGDTCESGSDRVLEAVKNRAEKNGAPAPDYVLNLQGDAPFTPACVLKAMIEGFAQHPDADVITPVHCLSWGDLDRLRESKKTTPFSGTTAIIGQDGRAIWFSKNILPAIRKEEKLRGEHEYSPVYQHMGLYGFKMGALEAFCASEIGVYEALEGLEQLRMLENGMRIQAIKIEVEEGVIQTGIDTPEDVARVEAVLAARGAA
jgi:3-deoxy-manno-octulosonate cytidylyltransferase (CMP-KDO synthetase)